MILFFGSFVVLLLIGVPISISIGASAILGCLNLGYPLMVIGQKMVSGIDSFLLIAIPLFILAGNLMNAGKITEKIFDFAKRLVGWIPGGLGHANVVASLIFAGMSG
ncbi:MAG: TRAP transporter large permease subunit, partial [Sphaerochaeta sp.]